MSKRLIKYFLDDKICLHLIRVAKIKNSTIIIEYNKNYIATRYDRQGDGKFLRHNYMETDIKDCIIPYEIDSELFQDVAFLKKWSINVKEDKILSADDIIRLVC
jgi:hypothetical protein